MPVRALNLYYARDASTRAQVLATRLRASGVRERIGIARGRVFALLSGNHDDLPGVMWDCPFPDTGAHEHDMQARAASVAFEACRATMRTLTRRFERVIYDETANAGAQAIAPMEHVLQIWMIGDRSAMPQVESFAFPSATTILHRADANVRLPDWIVEMPAVDSEVHAIAIKAWIARHAAIQETTLRWERAG